MTKTAPSRWKLFAYDPEGAGMGPLRWGLLVLVPLVGLALVWSFFAPLNAAAIAVGHIVLSGERKTVQHLEGGLVTKILVREGQAVLQDEPLLVVQDLAARVQIEALEAQLLNLRAQIARLEAERDGRDEADFSVISDGLAVPETAVASARVSHAKVLENLRRSYASAEELAASQKVQIAREIDGIGAQLDAKVQLIDLVQEELEAAETLLEKGLTTERKLSELQKSRAILEGEMGALLASTAKLEQAILDRDVEVAQMANERMQMLLVELQESQIMAENLRQELRTLMDQQARSVIRSPAAGKVLDMQIHTVGAVLTPGTPVMDIVPDNDNLIVEAQVNPTDIDLVAIGTEAKIQLSAFKARTVDRLDGRVIDVSADILRDDITGSPYYMARLEVDEAMLANLPADVALSPGMPADVFIIAGERTLADYIFDPITDAAYRAFRED